MVESLDKALASVAPGEEPAAALRSRRAAAGVAACFHCGQPCSNHAFTKAGKVFCCGGCQSVHELLNESGLGQFYDLSPHPGARVERSGREGAERWAYLDTPALQQRLLDFTDGKVGRVTFKIPSIHCVACVWLLENLFRLHAGLGEVRVNFPRREVSIRFSPEQIPLSRLVALLASIGYEPQLTLSELEKQAADAGAKRRWLQVGIAGFAFGNIMLLSLPGYFGLDAFSGLLFKGLFGWLSLALATPVLFYSASDYWRSALLSARQKVLTLDVPIALGLAALYARSAFEIISGSGPGYLDSMTGLVFFLLCGRAFQHRTHERLAFDRDYKCFFPLSVRRKTDHGTEEVPLCDLQIGERLVLRHGELIPADARLVEGAACVDYSFVTGESEPVTPQPGEHLYAGGQQVGGRIEVETVKPVSQSYLTSLWNHEAFHKQRPEDLNNLTNRFSRFFTGTVIAVAVAAALFWVLEGQAPRALKAFTSVLIVACPCALALAAPFAFGTLQRLLSRTGIFLRNGAVFESLAQVDTIVFDKTGTLTAAQASEVSFIQGSATPLKPVETQWVRDLAEHSTHPHSVRIAQFLAQTSPGESSRAGGSVGDSFIERPGLGVYGRVAGHELRLGSRAWLTRWGVQIPAGINPNNSATYLAINGVFRGVFVLANRLRPEAERLLAELGQEHELALLSGDNERERERFATLFGPGARLRFSQAPLGKLSFISELQADGRRVMMVGDGLNDAGALKQSDVGVAVVENVGAFCPASDVILAADQIPHLGKLLRLAGSSTRIVRWGLAISAVYNVAGVSIAAAGLLSPLVCAVLMPLSSVSVVLFACGMAQWAGLRAGIAPVSLNRSPNSRSPLPLSPGRGETAIQRFSDDSRAHFMRGHASRPATNQTGGHDNWQMLDAQ